MNCTVSEGMAEGKSIEVSGSTSNRELTAEELLAFRECCRQLQSPTPRTRRRAAERLGDLGPAAFEPLRRALIDLDVEVQVAAVGAISRIGGSECHELLLVALESDQLKTRTAAANMLEEVGGVESIAPLIRAYNQCFAGRSARRQRLAGPIALTVVAALLGAMAWSAAHNGSGVVAMIQLFFFLIIFLAKMRSRNSPQTFLCALLKIADRTPGPGLHVLLPELRAVANDRLLNDRKTRDASRNAVERIELLTASFQDLPVPADASRQKAAQLPVPAGEDEARSQFDTGGGK